MPDRDKMFAWTFSLAVGSLLMIILNVAFYGSSFATVILAATTAVNAALLATTYRDETKDLINKIFGKR